MKRILIVLAFFVVTFSSYGQYKGQWRALHGYEIPVQSGFFGMNFTGEYFPVNYLSIAPSFSFFIPATGNARGFDINARYYISEKEKQWYGLFGYGHYARVYEFNPIGRIAYNSINIGAGGMIKLRDELGINPEIRYQPIGRNDLIIKLSVIYFIN